VVDVYSIGRRSEGIHRVLLDRAAEGGIFYVYDTFAGSDMQAFDHRQHRELYASIAKRSRYFFVAPGKANVPEETRGQVEVGYRYFEGAAAGAVLIGQTPECGAFRRLFDWPDPVVQVRADGSDVVERLHELDTQPERLAEVSRRNATEALLRHDWIHRWKEVLAVAGVDAPPGMAAREAKLGSLARGA
jgi:hypothetical protein